MQYTASLPFRGDFDKSFQLAESALTAIGFRITERTATRIALDGPGMNSTRQSGLLGASCIRISQGQGQISVEADLGGAASMSRFVTLFPIGLVLSLGVVLSAVFAALFGTGIWIVAVASAVGGNTLLWLVLGPLLARGIQGRTRRAFDSLLANMVTVGHLT